jgi:hypothetical protein
MEERFSENMALFLNSIISPYFSIISHFVSGLLFLHESFYTFCPSEVIIIGTHRHTSSG